MKNTKKNETKKSPAYVRIIAIALVAIMAFSAISIAITVIAPMFASETEETHEH